MRRQGRVFYETYMFTKDKIVDSVVTIVRHRLQMSAPPQDISLETIQFSSEKYSKVCCYWISFFGKQSVNWYLRIHTLSSTFLPWIICLHITCAEDDPHISLQVLHLLILMNGGIPSCQLYSWRSHPLIVPLKLFQSPLSCLLFVLIYWAIKNCSLIFFMYTASSEQE